MIEGKVKALFSDKERTELLFPITKTSAITNDDGVGLDAIISDTVYSDTNAIKATAVPVNADTLGGKPADEFATQNYVAAEIAKAQLNGGDVDLSGFATKDEVSNAVNGIDFPVDSVNGKTGVVSLSADDVGATPASHLEDKNNPHSVTPEQIGAHPNSWVPTAEQVGAAPHGFGLGTNHLTWVSPNSLDSIVVPGWYHYYGQATTLNNVKFNHASLFVYPYEMDPTACVQEIRPYATNTVLRRLYFNNVWRDWECENPPMELDKEYRTTEKYWANAVYTILISCGTLATGRNVIPHKLSGVSVRRYSGSCGADAIPYLDPDYNGEMKIAVSGSNIIINATSGFAGNPAYVQLWYTKN